MKDKLIRAWFVVAIAAYTFIIIGASCSPTRGDEKIITFDEPADDLQSIFAFNLSSLPQEGPEPIPDNDHDRPKIGDVCPICGGTGKADLDHDGKIDVDCLACGKDGKIDEGDPILNASYPVPVRISPFEEEHTILYASGSSAKADIVALTLKIQDLEEVIASLRAEVSAIKTQKIVSEAKSLLKKWGPELPPETDDEEEIPTASEAASIYIEVKGDRYVYDAEKGGFISQSGGRIRWVPKNPESNLDDLKSIVIRFSGEPPVSVPVMRDE